MCTSAQTLEHRCVGFNTGTGQIAVFDRPDRPSGIDHLTSDIVETMEPTSSDSLPDDVLIVEDDPIIALDLEDTLLGLGVKTARIAGNVAKAIEMIADRAPDFALLDVGLIREKSFAIAERLVALNIPFAFVTGYGPDVHLPPAFANTPRLLKPFSTEALEALLRRRSEA
jgi:CheY-like chemotaxis protein